MLPSLRKLQVNRFCRHDELLQDEVQGAVNFAGVGGEPLEDIVDLFDFHFKLYFCISVKSTN
jgi:hypothetical protein